MAENPGSHHVQAHYSLHTDLDHRPSYIFKPDYPKNSSGHPNKRRRTNGFFRGHDDEDVVMPFVPLLNGLEGEELVQKRYHTFRRLWDRQEKSVQEIFKTVDATILRDVSTFIKNVSPHECNGHIAAGLFNLGSNISSMARLLNHLRNDLHIRRTAKIITLESGDAPNLKTALRHIIREATTNDDSGTIPVHTGAQTGTKYLSYDLDALHEHMQKQGMRNVVIAFQDSEAFDQTFLTDLLSLLNSWTDRISFILLFGVATSVELFEGRLARTTVNLLQGTRFDIQGCEDLIERIFVTLQMQPDNVVWLGPHVSEIILKKSKDHFESPESFAYGMKYAYMTHFFANPLSVLCSGDCSVATFQPELCEAIRNTYSFQHHVEGLIGSGRHAIARGMLESDKVLAAEVLRIITQNREKTDKALRATRTIAHLMGTVLTSQRIKVSELIIQAFLGDLLDSNEMDDFLATIKKQSSEETMSFLLSLPPDMKENDTFISLTTDLKLLVNRRTGETVLRSEYDDRNQVHTTSVVGRRVQLNKGKAKLSTLDLQYTRLIDRLSSALRDYFVKNLVQEELLLHEAFICDLKMPLKRVLAPRSRFTIERALSSPFDYLIPQPGMSKRAAISSQPAISIAYQLYLESGGTINVYDWWSTFYTVIGGKDGELCEERMAMTLFYEALSQLKLLGMIKSTKKKVDHVAKVAWMGI